MRSAWEMFKADLAKYYLIHSRTSSPPLRAKLKLWLMHDGLHCVAIYRFGQLAEQLTKEYGLVALPAKQLSRLLNTYLSLFHHIELGADIGAGFYVGHATTIYFGELTIGENFSVGHNVTIGMGHGGHLGGVPKVGNDVWIGTGSVISGAIQISDGVTVAQGTILSRDVPAGCFVGGNPARLVIRDYDNSHLLRWQRSVQNKGAELSQPNSTVLPEHRAIEC